MELKNYLSLIKFSHTVFALPFALVGFALGLGATGGEFTWKTFGLVVLCMIFARSAAMAFNRYLDRDIDAANPRTKVREIPSGIISETAALRFVIFSALAFVICTFFINQLCFFLSPVALLVILGYSYTKRFTSLCHFVLGLGLSLAPIGAYLAVTGAFAVLPLLFSAVVLLWVAGFDIIYALQDEDFDRKLNLNSIPTRLGTQKSLQLSNVLHAVCAVLMLLATYFSQQTLNSMPILTYDFSVLIWLGCITFICFLYYQHTLVKADDLSRVDMAFFTTNGIASMVYGACFLLDFFL